MSTRARAKERPIPKYRTKLEVKARLVEVGLWDRYVTFREDLKRQGADPRDARAQALAIPEIAAALSGPAPASEAGDQGLDVGEGVL